MSDFIFRKFLKLQKNVTSGTAHTATNRIAPFSKPFPNIALHNRATKATCPF